MLETKKSKLKDWIYRNRYLLLTIAFFIVLCIIPMLLMAAPKGHDYKFHYQRIVALRDEMSYGNFFPRIYSTLLDGNGYASPLFYGDLFLMIPSGLMLYFGASLTTAYAFFVGFIFCATAISMYCCTFSITKNQKSAFCGTILYSLSSYLATDLIERAAIGESQSFIFIPIVFVGFYHILYGEIKKWYWLPIGLSSMLYCHMLSSLTTVLALFIFLLFSLKQLKEKPQRLIYLGISVALFFALSANLIFPMLEQFASTKFLATSGFSATKWGTLKSHAIPAWIVLFNFENIPKSYDFFIPNGIGQAGYIFAAFYFYHSKKYNDFSSDKNKMILKCILVAAITLFMTTTLFPWQLFQNVFGILQFPWRLLVYPTFFIALGAAIYFGKKTHKQKLRTVVMFVVIAFSIYSYIACVEVDFRRYVSYRFNGVTSPYEYENHIGSAEYLPEIEEFKYEDLSADARLYCEEKFTAQDEIEHDDMYKASLIAAADEVYTDGNGQVSFERKNGKLIVNFSNIDRDNAYLDVPLVMYKGYTAHLEDGTELICSYGTYNRIRVNVGNVREGTVTFEYSGTALQKMSDIISILAVVSLVVYFIVEHIKNKKKQNLLN